MDALAGNIKWTIRWPQGEQKSFVKLLIPFFPLSFSSATREHSPQPVTQRFCTAILDFPFLAN